MLSVKRMEPQPCSRVKVAFPLNHVVLGVAPDSVLGSKDSLNGEGALPVVRKQTVENMNQPARDRSLIADQTDPAALEGAAVVGEQAVESEKGRGHEETVPVEGPEDLKAKVSRASTILMLWGMPAIGCAFAAAFISSPDSPMAALIPAFLPMQATLLLLTPISVWLSWKKGRAPLHFVLPICFGLFLVIGRLVLDAWGMTLVLLPGRVRADLAWTEWPLLLGCVLVQFLMLWLARDRCRDPEATEFM